MSSSNDDGPTAKHARSDELPAMTTEQRDRLHRIFVTVLDGDMYASKRDVGLNDAIVCAHVNSGNAKMIARLLAEIVGRGEELSWPLTMQLAHRYGATPETIAYELVEYAVGHFAAAVTALEHLCETTAGLAMPDIDDVVKRAINSDMSQATIVRVFGLAFRARPQLQQPIARAAFEAADSGIPACAERVAFVFSDEPAIINTFAQAAHAVLPRDKFDVFAARLCKELAAQVTGLDEEQREADAEHERETARRRNLMRELGALLTLLAPAE
jgi:hypothetical protein